ncbi:unnamed protein product [Caenorhabditis auriculariae]|uniref:Uncharacterized protein n=1 Tax=Caenorhabditis auriculariae TaxID=2777116 RepID=A0A8S1H3Y7_9PELO|nr:unnamed protein product [Caenorhabditis auriculariae]
MLKWYISAIWFTLLLFYYFKYKQCPEFFCKPQFSCSGNRKAYIIYNIHEIGVYVITVFTLIAYISIYRHVKDLTRISTAKRNFEKFILLQAMPMTIVRTIREVAVLGLVSARAFNVKTLKITISREDYDVFCFFYYLDVLTLALVVPLSFILNRKNYPRAVAFIKNDLV